MFAQKEKPTARSRSSSRRTGPSARRILKKAEQELAELRALKEQPPEMIKKAEQRRPVAIANNSLKKEYEHKKLIAAEGRRDGEAAGRRQIAALTQRSTSWQSRSTDLKQQIEQAHQRVTDISTKALDSASGRATTEALQRMMETEKMSGKSTSDVRTTAQTEAKRQAACAPSGEARGLPFRLC